MVTMLWVRCHDWVTHFGAITHGSVLQLEEM